MRVGPEGMPFLMGCEPTGQRLRVCDPVDGRDRPDEETHGGRASVSGPQADRAPAAVGQVPVVEIVLSQRLASPGAGLDLAALRDWLQARLPAVHADVVPDPTRRPNEIARVVAESGAQRLVLGLASGERATAEIQAQVCKAGLDPLGLAVVRLGAHAALGPGPVGTERAKLLLAGAVAKTRAFPGSRPEHLKISLSVALSRRAFFTLSAHEYSAVPAVAADRCAIERGCQRCVEVCPRGALRQTEHRVEVNKARCERCGLCVSACPWGAVEYPGYSAAEMDAQLGALLDPALGELTPRGVLFACERTSATVETMVERGLGHPAGWLPVVVPCTGMLSPALFLRCLALGAVGVGVVPCSRQCPFGQDAVVADRVAFCRELVGLLGGQPDRVKLCTLTDEGPSAWALPGNPPVAPLEVEPPTPFRANWPSNDPRSGVEALLHLAEAHGASAELTYAHAQSPFGVVQLDPVGCTVCEACVAACPTGALTGQRQDGTIAITFGAALCTACGWCVRRCPEASRGVLSLKHGVDLHRLWAGRTPLHRDQTLRCLDCGVPIASGALMVRLADLLGEEYGTLAGTITRYCLDCRGRAIPAGPRVIVSQGGPRFLEQSGELGRPAQPLAPNGSISPSSASSPGAPPVAISAGSGCGGISPSRTSATSSAIFTRASASARSLSGITWTYLHLSSVPARC